MNNDIKKIFSEKIKEAKGLEHPRVLVNICSHGNEVIGLEIQKKCKNLNIKNGSLSFNVGNPEAVRQGKRFIESDLNRSFPGSENGTYEEKIAFYMMKYIKLFDYVIDIHSTVSGMDKCLIVEDNSQEIKQLISVCNNCDTVLHMKATKGSSIFLACRQSNKKIPAIAFEYGNNSNKIIKKTYDDLIRIFVKIGIIQQKIKIVNLNKPKQFKCNRVLFKKKGDVIEKNITNYKQVKKGDVIGHTAKNIPIVAKNDFYPVLFGETNYEKIFGFMARKL